MEQQYKGVHQDINGGMTHVAQIFKDAWVFELLPETEDGAGWGAGRVQALYEKVYAQWERYGHLPSNLPQDLRLRHERIHQEAIQRGRESGWNPELGEDD